MISGVYRITSTVSGKSYVGSSQNIRSRLNWHKCVLRNENHHSQALQRAWRKYGEVNFEFVVIENCAVELLEEREQYWMDELNVLGPTGYNVQPHARSSRGFKMSKETCKKLSIAAKKLVTDEERERRSKRAKKQHREGKFGAKTWKTGPKSTGGHEAGINALRKHIAKQLPEEMRRRSLMRKNIKAEFRNHAE